MIAHKDIQEILQKKAQQTTSQKTLFHVKQFLSKSWQVLFGFKQSIQRDKDRQRTCLAIEHLLISKYEAHILLDRKRLASANRPLIITISDLVGYKADDVFTACAYIKARGVYDVVLANKKYLILWEKV